MTIEMIVYLSIGTTMAVAFILLSMAVQGKYAPLVAALDDNEHPFKSIYPVGFWVLDALSVNFDSKIAREKRHQMSLLHGNVYAEYYMRLNYAQKISVGLFILPFGFLTYSLFMSPVCLLVGFGGAALAWWYFDLLVTDTLKEHQEEINRDFADVILKLALLVNAGMILVDAWERVSRTGDSQIYREMQYTVEDIQSNGASEAEAILSFGTRCMNQDIKKFASTLVQSIQKGSKELVEFLRAQSDASWEMRREYARQKGEEASSKLMLPIAGMMLGVMVMIVVPIFSSLF